MIDERLIAVRLGVTKTFHVKHSSQKKIFQRKGAKFAKKVTKP